MDIGPVRDGKLTASGNEITITINTELHFGETFTTKIDGRANLIPDGNLTFNLISSADPKVHEFVGTPLIDRELSKLNTADQSPMKSETEESDRRPGTPPPADGLTVLASAAPNASLKLTFI